MTYTNNSSRSHKKRNLSITGLVMAVAIFAMMYAQNGEAMAIQNTATASRISSTPFDFELPDGAVDGKRYSHVREGGMPEAAVIQGTTVSLPIVIRPSGDKQVTVDFYTTFGDQLDTQKLPPGVSVSIQPSTVILQPGKDSMINLVVQVDKNAPDGTYMQNIVGKWGGPDDFLGSAVSLKIGNGTPKFVFSGDIGQ